MIVREIRRFLRRGRFTALLAGVILAIGFSAAAVTFNVIRAFARPWNSGLTTNSFATVARQTSTGGLSAIDWHTVEHLRRALRVPQSGMIAYARPTTYLLQWQGQSAQVSIAFTEPDFFTQFTEGLRAGHTFSSGWESGVDEGEAIVSDDFSRRFFGSIQNSLNQKIRIAGQSFTVIGVAPRGFGGLWAHTDLWSTPDQADRLGTAAFREKIDNPDVWRIHSIWYFLVAESPQIRPTPVETLSKQLRDDNNEYLHLQAVEGLTDDPVSDRTVHASSQLGFVVAIALLLSASLNYCILLIARSSVFVEEFRLKRVLGATPDSLVVDATIGPLFVVLTSFLLSGVVTVAAQRMLELGEKNPVVASGLALGSALRMLAVEFPLGCLLGASIALVPAITLMRQSGAPMTGSKLTRTQRHGFILNGIVVVEIAVCTLVCLFAGTFVQEYYRLSKVDMGFDSRNLTSFESNLTTKGGGLISFQTTSGGNFPMEDFVRLSMSEAKDQLSGLQGIAAASCTPFGPPMRNIDLYPLQPGTEPLKAVSVCAVSQSFFSTMGMRIFEGSGFTRDDYNGYISHILINVSLARELWPQRDAINQSMHLEEPASNLGFDARVVGVADDTRLAGAASSPQPTVYVPLTGNAYILSFPVYFLARGTPSWKAFSEIVRKESEGTVRNLGIVRSFSIEEKVHKAWQEQQYRLNFALFGAIFVASIAYIGLYGVLIHSVLARQKELALRLSFGASRWALRRVVIERVLLCCFAAICLALLVWKTCFGFLDPKWMCNASWSWEASGITSLLCAIAATAISVIPAGRATRISPATLLKEE